MRNLQKNYKKIAHKDIETAKFLTYFVPIRLREFLNYCTAPYKYMGGNRPKE